MGTQARHGHWKQRAQYFNVWKRNFGGLVRLFCNLSFLAHFFLVGTVFFSHHKSIKTVFQFVFSAKRTRPDSLILWILHADECKQRQLAWGDRTRWTDSRNTRVTDFHFGVHCTARAQENDWLVFFYIDWVIKYINKAQNSQCILENQEKNRKV